LQSALAPDCEVLTPEHYGSESVGPWSGEHAFTLHDEAAHVVEILADRDGPVHLVGHSYGGAVALQVALEWPHRVATLSLYEPCAFRLLRDLGEPGERALFELRSVAAQMMAGVADGAYARTAESFVDYWSGPGTWTTLRASARASVIRWVTKAPLDFRATVGATADARAYAGVRCRTLIMRGERAPTCTRLIADALESTLSNARLELIKGAGHMGPLTHSEAVNAAIARHIRSAGRAEAGSSPPELLATA